MTTTTTNLNLSERFHLEVKEADGTWKKVATSSREDSPTMKNLAETYGWLQETRVVDSRKAEMEAAAAKAAAEDKAKAERLSKVNAEAADLLERHGRKVGWTTCAGGAFKRIAEVNNVSVSVGIEYPYSRGYRSTPLPARMLVRVAYGKEVRYPEKKAGGFSLDKAVARIEDEVIAALAAAKREAEAKAGRQSGHAALKAIAESHGKTLSDYGREVYLGSSNYSGRVMLTHNDRNANLTLSVSGLTEADARKLIDMLKTVEGLVE
jgi:hypothetical protein